LYYLTVKKKPVRLLSYIFHKDM